MNESEMNSLQLKKYTDLMNMIGEEVELTKSEKKTLVWLADLPEDTVDDIVSIIAKVKVNKWKKQ